ncbi:MAG TPA: DnaB-like helicase C-terminal domain-containing protein [Bacteroidales bacterium]|nr:DnaB-like helicase C-terminal domain-containing protein [Bacteroidales bacterium]
MLLDNISKNYYHVDEYKVYTDIGFIDIDYIIETIPFRKMLVLFESGIEIECADNHVFITSDDEEIFARDVFSGCRIKGIDCIETVFDVFDTGENVEMYDISLPHHHKFYTGGVLSHNSNTLANIGARQVLHGHNVFLCTLEMSEDAFAQRFDSIFSKLDINKMYTLESMKGQLISRLRKIKSETPDRGKLIIKQFPTGEASVQDIKRLIREWIIRGIKPDIIYLDYINIMKPTYSSKDNLYSDVKRIAEECRAMSFQFECPVVSVSQLNREGSMIAFNEVDFVYIAESMGVPATADFMAIYGIDDEKLIYESELHYKIVKNRIGGRVGEVDKFYYDSRSLKMYDSSELDMWLEDAKETGDERNVVQITQEYRGQRSRLSRGRR